MKKQIVIKVQGAISIPYTELTPFQGDLKTLSKEKYELFRENILKEGISFVLHVWRNNGHNYIIDGHQRLFVIKQMVEIEGYEVGPLPVALTEADSFKEAKRKVLAGASEYGQMSEDSLFAFVLNADLDIQTIVAEFSLPNIDMQALSEKFATETPESESLPLPEQTGSDMPSSSSQVKQIQLLFNAGNYEEFISIAKALASVYKTENITDTVVEVLREDYNLKFGKPQ